MDYKTIVSKSWASTVKYRYVWWLGLLVVMIESGAGNLYFNFKKYRENLSSDQYPVEVSQAMEAVRHSIITHPTAYIGAIVGLAILSIILFYIGGCALSGLIQSGAKDPKASKLKSLFADGRTKAWSMVGVYALSALAISIVTGFFMIPASITYYSSNGLGNPVAVGTFSALALIGGVVAVPVSAYFSAITKYAYRAVALEGLGPIRAIRETFNLINSQIWRVAIIWAVDTGIRLGYYILFTIFSAIFLVCSLYAYTALDRLGQGTAVIALVISAVSTLVILILIPLAYSILVVFVNNIWTKSYLSLKQAKSDSSTKDSQGV